MFKTQFDFYGNTESVQTLTCSLTGGRLSHAYLFYGPKGSGKRTLAIQFAQAILCRDTAARPCGHCPDCLKVSKLIHPDLLLEGGDGGKSSFHAEVVRKIRSEAYIRPNSGDYKVYILCGVENMSTAAANALLKVLEEPPRHVVFLLTCESKRAIPETLVSRCVPVALYPVEPRECAEAVARLSGESDQAQIDYAVSLSGGLIGGALGLLTEKEMRQASEIAQKLRDSLLSPDELDTLVAGAPLDGNRALTLRVLPLLTGVIRKSILSKVGAKPDPLACKYSLKALLRMVQTIDQAQSNLERNANLGLTLCWLCAGLRQTGALHHTQA